MPLPTQTERQGTFGPILAPTGSSDADLGSASARRRRARVADSKTPAHVISLLFKIIFICVAIVVISEVLPKMPVFFSQDAFDALHKNKAMVMLLLTQLLSRYRFAHVEGAHVMWRGCLFLSLHSSEIELDRREGSFQDSSTLPPHLFPPM